MLGTRKGGKRQKKQQRTEGKVAKNTKREKGGKTQKMGKDTIR